MPASPSRVLLADDHPVWRRGVRGLLEGDVLRLLAEGRSDAEVLFVSENTVQSHLTAAYAKVGVASAREAAAWA